MRTVTGAEPPLYLEGSRQELVDRFGHPVEQLRAVWWEEVVMLKSELGVEGAETKVVPDGDLGYHLGERQNRRVIPGGHQDAEAAQERGHSRRIQLPRGEHARPLRVLHLELDR